MSSKATPSSFPRENDKTGICAPPPLPLCYPLFFKGAKLTVHLFLGPVLFSRKPDMRTQIGRFTRHFVRIVITSNDITQSRSGKIFLLCLLKHFRYLVSYKPSDWLI